MALHRWCRQLLADSSSPASFAGLDLRFRAARPVSAVLSTKPPRMALSCAYREKESSVSSSRRGTQRRAFSCGWHKDDPDSPPAPPADATKTWENEGKNENTSNERIAQLEQQVKELHGIMAEYERHMKEYVLEKVLDIEDEMREVRRSSGVQTAQHQSSVEKAEAPPVGEYIQTSTGVQSSTDTSETWRGIRDANTIDVAVVHVSNEQQRDPSAEER